MIFYSVLICFFIAGQKYGDEMSLHCIHLWCEGNQWRKYWEEKYTKGNNGWKPETYQETQKKLWERLLHADTLVETIDGMEKDCYLNIYKILEIA